MLRLAGPPEDSSQRKRDGGRLTPGGGTALHSTARRGKKIFVEGMTSGNLVGSAEKDDILGGFPGGK